MRSLHREHFLDYLRHYETQNLEAIAALLAENVVLRDWKIRVQGKAAVLAETAANFAQAQSLTIEVLTLTESQHSVAGELRIVVNGEIELFVVDVLEFDADGRISAIRAYLGRGDA